MHSQPSPDLYLSFGNILWTLVFGWWLALVCVLISIILFLTPFGGADYGSVVLGLSFYLLWPFGQYVERELYPGEVKTEELHSHSASESNRHHYAASSSNGHGQGYGTGNRRHTYHSPPDESRPLLQRNSSTMDRERTKRRVSIARTIKNFPRTIYHLGLGGIVYYGFYYLLIGKSTYITCSPESYRPFLIASLSNA